MSAARVALIVAGGVLTVVVLVFGAPFLLGIMMGDPAPERSAAPLEFVAVDADGGTCALNREDVAAGVHEFSIITEGSGATVELLDETGSTVFRSEDGLQGSAFARSAEGTDALRLEKGRYTVVCRYPDGAAGEVTLTVTAE